MLVVFQYRRSPTPGSLDGVAKEHRDRQGADASGDRKSTRLNSSHGYTSYAVFCLKKKTADEEFFVSCYSGSPHLLSFPTRRSSDRRRRVASAVLRRFIAIVKEPRPP